MNRPIKFRAWDGNKMFHNITIYNGTHWDSVKDCDTGNIVMQFTGLTDKNGKEIYEGDKTDAGEVVVFEDGIFGTTYEGNQQGVARLSAKRCEHIVIVGNIYEPPLPVA